MIEMIGEKYLTEKEASQRYGYSLSWFSRLRAQKSGPKFIQLKTHGRVLYHLENTDSWFKERFDREE